MKNKIKQLAKGDFKFQRPDIVFSQTHLQISVCEGEVYQGSFFIENQNGGNIRGLVYSSSFRMHCLEPGFDKNPVEIHFTFDSTGLKPGQGEQGKFTVVCNGGEYDVTFSVIVEKPFVMTIYGKIQSIDDFRELAMQDFSEARRLFRTRQFYDVLRYEEQRVKVLYDNIRKWSLDEQALEEFLVGIGQKDKIHLWLSTKIISHKNVTEDKKDYINISKNTWGFLPIRVYTNDEFLKLEENEITTEDFIGNRYRLEYIIRKDKLHNGYNFGKVYIETAYETLEMEIQVHQCVAHKETMLVKGMTASEGLKNYLELISGKMELNEWTEKTIECVKQLKELERDSKLPGPNFLKDYYTLLQAHIYLRGGREEKAKEILESGDFGRFVLGRKGEINAYYLFLMALLKKDAVSVNKALDEVNRMSAKSSHAWQFSCMKIHLEPKYKNYNERIRVLEHQFYCGKKTVLLYAEAYICFQEKVPLLRKLDAFEIQILNFATKHKMITKELAIHAAELIAQQRTYNKKLVSILERAYGMYEEPKILHALCMQLIKGNRIGGNYFKWYEMAVEKELKLAQLYEYYMMSMNMQYIRKPFPKIVYLYFMHGINLDHKRTALLYANILTYENEDSDIYKTYQPQIQKFAWEQLQKRRINSALRVIYNRFIREKEVTLDTMDALYDICHKYHVTTERPGMKYVLVIEKDGKIAQRVAYTETGASVYLYDKESQIVWEGKDGRHYIESIPYDIVRLFYEMRYMELCKKHIQNRIDTQEELNKILLTFENLKQYGIEAFNEDEVFFLCSRRIREQEDVEDDFLLYVSFELLKRGQYDKAVLSYLARFYCGATADMKLLWRKAREYGVSVVNLSERIITQMLFSESMFCEEKIFEDYYVGKPYFRLKQAYLAYVSNLYVVCNRELDSMIIAIIMKELEQQSYLADICKAAVLKYFAEKGIEEKFEDVLHEYFCEMCDKKMIFAFYQKYPKSWLKEVQLYDKYIVEYHAGIGENSIDENGFSGKVKIVYSIDNKETCTEVLVPSYQNTYIKEFILYSGETLQYYFQEEEEGNIKITERENFTQSYLLGEQYKKDGKYGNLNYIASLLEEKRLEAMLQYKKEEVLAKEMFPVF